MKRVKILLMVALMALTLMACGNDNASTEDSTSNLAATIVTNEGETVEMTAQELMDVYDGNEAAFEKKYNGAKITFTGTVKKIETNTSYSTSESAVHANSGGDTIAFEEGWTLIISERSTYPIELADLNVGDKLVITTGIETARSYTDFMKQALGEDRAVWCVGNDKFGSEGTYEQYLDQYNDITTIIERAE